MTDEEFTDIAKQYSDNIFRIAFNYCRNRADSDDIVQNVLIKLYRSDKKFENDEHIKNWIIRVTVNECKKLLISPFKKNTISLETISETITFESQEESDLYYAVMELPQKYRIIVHMYYYEDYSINEIADMLEENSSTVATRLQRARKRLKDKLKEVWNND